jgi:hypothetical protein
MKIRMNREAAGVCVGWLKGVGARTDAFSLSLSLSLSAAVVFEVQWVELFSCSVAASHLCFRKLKNSVGLIKYASFLLPIV